MAIETWINQLANIWGEIENGRGGTIRSFSPFQEDFPEAAPADITANPFCISYPTSLEFDITTLQGAEERWTGVTEFHLFGDLGKSHLPEVLLFIAKIRDKASSNLTLKNKDGAKTLDLFSLRSTDGPTIEGPIGLAYGDESPHWGLILHWIAFENTSGDFTISA